MVAVEGILNLRSGFTKLLSQRLRIGEGEDHTVAVEAEHLVDVDTVQQRDVNIPLELIVGIVAEDILEVHVHRVGLEHDSQLSIAQSRPYTLRVTKGLGGDML